MIDIPLSLRVPPPVSYTHLLVLVLDARGRVVPEFLELGHGVADVSQKHVCHVARHALANHYAHDDHLVDVLGHGVCRDHPAALLQGGLQVEQRPDVYKRQALYRASPGKGIHSE